MFDQATAQAIAERISTGEPLEAICRELPGAPTSWTVHSWVNNNPEFSQHFARARAMGHDAIAWRARDIARGNVAAGSTGDVARDKLIVETDLKLLAKWDKRYSDTQKVELTGANGADLFAGMSKVELQAELVRRISNPELVRALQAAGVTVAALPGTATKVSKG